MSTDHELHLLADQVQGKTHNGSKGLPPVVVQRFHSIWFSRSKRLWAAIKRQWHILWESFSLLYLSWATDWWVLEILSWFSALLALGMIALVLGLHQNKPVPRWFSGITVNSLLSVLSQMGQWGLMGSVAKALGQLKWLWFARPKRPLMEFVAFDEASRGPWGSLVILGRGRLLSAITYSPTQALFMN